jgi:hypothetical protein
MRYKSRCPFWEKKRHSRAVKTVHGTSQVLLLIKFFGRDDLKPEKPNGHQTALKV